jgi:hypothetical protein
VCVCVLKFVCLSGPVVFDIIAFMVVNWAIGPAGLFDLNSIYPEICFMIIIWFHI